MKVYAVAIFSVDGSSKPLDRRLISPMVQRFCNRCMLVSDKYISTQDADDMVSTTKDYYHHNCWKKQVVYSRESTVRTHCTLTFAFTVLIEILTYVHGSIETRSNRANWWNNNFVPSWHLSSWRRGPEQGELSIHRHFELSMTCSPCKIMQIGNKHNNPVWTSIIWSVNGRKKALIWNLERALVFFGLFILGGGIGGWN